MGLQIENQEKIVKEQEIQKRLYQSIDERKSFVFNAGAGSGKTYALVQCLKYVINQYGTQLSVHNQGVLCITYTNVAANHIKEEIGNTNLVKVSTIHERIWDLIKLHQAELVELHMEKLQEEIRKSKEVLEETHRYRDLGEKQETFCELLKIHKAECKKAFRNGQNANDFRELLPEEIKQNSGNLLNSVAEFKKIVSTIFKIEEYQECLDAITKGDKGYDKIEYDARYNNDWLVKMRISHDTVLEYGFGIIKKYDVLKQMIVDCFPYIFIDEYQDTSVEVVCIMKELDAYSKESSRPVCVGYFGDTVQSIYSDGVGNKLQEYHEIETVINKEFNRRSYEEIIQIANQFRNDDLVQESIYDDCTGGSVEAFVGEEAAVEEFIEKYKKEWQASSDNQVHCFLTRNENVARYNGFGNLYSLFKDADVYKGPRYEQLNSEVLSNQIENLGAVPSLFYRIINFYVLVNNDETMIRELLKKSKSKEMKVSELRELIKELREVKGESLEEIVSSMEMVAKREKDAGILNEVMDLEQEVSVAAVRRFIRKKLFTEIEAADEEYENKESEIEEKVTRFMTLSIEELKKWYQYVVMSVTDAVVYHTYHGTKGLEYENVIMIMGDGIGAVKKKTLFFDYFVKCSEEENPEETAEYVEARNLLYVAVTRAIKNLRVLYIGGQMTNEQLEAKFKKVKSWSDEE